MTRAVHAEQNEVSCLGSRYGSLDITIRTGYRSPNKHPGRHVRSRLDLCDQHVAGHLHQDVADKEAVRLISDA